MVYTPLRLHANQPRTVSPTLGMTDSIGSAIIPARWRGFFLSIHLVNAINKISNPYTLFVRCSYLQFVFTVLVWSQRMTKSQ